MIDFVFPYVNSLDVNWQYTFKQYCIQKRIKYNESCRFRDWGLLRYLFRSIALNLPFVGNLYMIVSSESQVPSWINRKYVNVVLHKDIIPKEYLPTFNSTCIEMFLYKIPGLFEKFLYSNDDIYVMKKLQENDFYEDNLPKVALSLKNTAKAVSQFRKVVIHCQDLVKGDFKNIKIPAKKYYRPPHFITPMLKSTHQKVWQLHKDEIEKSISALRELKNYNQYIFTDYQVFSGKNININVPGTYCDFTSKTLEEIKNCIEKPERSLLCINDNNRTPDNMGKLLRVSFDKMFPLKCKYEV